VYDAYGNLLDDGTNQYTYDAAMRLTAVTDGVSTSTFAYNGDGDRVSQTVDGTLTTYVLDTATPLTMVLVETTGEDSIYYLHGLDLVAQSDGTNTEYFAYDGLGSVRQVVDEAAGVLLAQTYDPYGGVYASAGPGETHFGWTGEQMDASGLVYLRARYYSPLQGRFFQRDTWSGDLNQPQTLNPYMYGLGNPLLYRDPGGNQVGEGVAIVVETIFIVGVIYFATVGYLDVVSDGRLDGRIGAGCEAPPDILEGLETLVRRVPSIPALNNPSPEPDRQQHPSENPETEPLPDWRPYIDLTRDPEEEDPRVPLYRAVTDVEWTYITSHGFLNYGHAGDHRGKYFALTYGGMENYANASLNMTTGGVERYTYTMTTVPGGVLNEGYLFSDVGGAGPSIHFSDTALDMYVYPNMTPIQYLGEVQR
jgi:RHS repeat-associated protein